MPPVIERVEKEKKPKLGGGGPGKIPYRRGYGGGDDGEPGRRDDFLSSRERLRRFRIGMVAGIISVTMLFAGLTVVYIWRQGTGRWDPHTHVAIADWHPLTLPYQLLFINILLGVFNLIPVPPLDGSHVVRHLLPQPVLRTYDAVGWIGLIALVYFAPRVLWALISPVLRFFANILLALIGSR